MATFEAIRGGYFVTPVNGVDYRVFYEEAGQGLPLLCLHTAGADSRQWRHVLNDPDITSRFRVVAFDMPYHGRSNPPDGWWLKTYSLTPEFYVAAIRAVSRALELQKPIVMGCSMGGIIVLKLAIDHPDEVRGIIGLESAATLKGRYNDLLHHPAVHGSEFCATYTYGLNSPNGPESGKRENWWYYAQGGPGIYAGDTLIGRNFDIREEVKSIDTRRCKVSLLTGEFDYSATPEMSREVAGAVAGSRFQVMKGMGHFPIIEDYSRFKPYLMEELAFMEAN